MSECKCKNCGCNKKWHVNLIESERGWGSKVDDVKEFDTREAADAYVTKFNAKNDKDTIPDWYMYAEAPYQK